MPDAHDAPVTLGNPSSSLHSPLTSVCPSGHPQVSDAASQTRPAAHTPQLAVAPPQPSLAKPHCASAGQPLGVQAAVGKVGS